MKYDGITVWIPGRISSNGLDEFPKQCLKNISEQSAWRILLTNPLKKVIESVDDFLTESLEKLLQQEELEGFYKNIRERISKGIHYPTLQIKSWMIF